MARQASAMVKEFHRAMGHPIARKPAIPDMELVALREKLIEEECREAIDASWHGDIVEFAKELADIIYVVHGAAIVYGIPLDEVFEAVHQSNMSKLGPDGKPVYREDGKVMKGENYSPPDIGAIINGKNGKISREN